MKTIEMVRSKDGTYRQRKIEAKPVSFKMPKRSRKQVNSKALTTRFVENLNDELEEIGIEAINVLLNGILSRR